ncbi:ELAV-like protein 2 [Physella acuta]|uniref:ELAV-like protein 2 n=1 Tax=Physella acuta TaxID=109671 RepID=UPI0027DE891C|nr:ELAV-like protein 2 [Physella acuta]XP_059155263.1 ELAV-like protein 2 [Physella acuta]XP_059155271.1 ELAV-like protein 2 [Physella acuta]XP_059155280.1 ELAV-like protein 2 [Physella acuta]XP_059155287.1 ELAV-like protein 2 [Physella acuta]XP_059155296.1 ELAV-like protein 2 [Physella acuta]
MEDQNDGNFFIDDSSSTNLIINYLPQTLSDDEFRSMFLSVGPIKSSKIVRDKATGYSYGFGFVDFQHAADAQRAIETLSGLQLQNKRIKVALARPGGDQIKGANLYIRNLPVHWKEGELNKIFDPFGKIIQSRVLVDLSTGISKRVGFVLYDTRDEAESAIKVLSGKTPEGCTEPIMIKFADDNTKKMKQGTVQYVPIPNFAAPGPMRNQMNRFQRFNPMAGNFNGSPGVPQAQQGGYTLFVYNIGFQATDRTLWQLFSPFGTVQKVNIMLDHEKNQCKGYGFVTMTNYQEAQNAINCLNGYFFQGRVLQVSFKGQNQTGPN